MNNEEFIKNQLPKLRRKCFGKLTAYAPGEQPKDPAKWIKLNTNENPYEPPEAAVKELAEALKGRLRLYPDPTATELRKLIAEKYLGRYQTFRDPDNVVVANGSDEILDIIFKTFIDPGDSILDFTPSYGMYSVLADTYDAREITIPLNEDFSVPVLASQQTAKLMIICSPNNPDGNAVSSSTIAKICENFRGMVVVDEAYADFANDSVVSLVPKYANLMVCRTFSKAMSLVSARLGFVIVHKSIADLFNTVRLPYNVSFGSQMAGILILRHFDEILQKTKKIIAERQRIIGELTKNGFKILPTQSNFYMVEFKTQKDAQNAYEELKQRKILIRYWNKPRLDRYLRVSVGLPEQNDAFLKNLIEITRPK